MYEGDVLVEQGLHVQAVEFPQQDNCGVKREEEWQEDPHITNKRVKVEVKAEIKEVDAETISNLKQEKDTSVRIDVRKSWVIVPGVEDG